MKRFLPGSLTVALALLALSVGACGGDDDNTGGKSGGSGPKLGTIKIGHLVPLTGDLGDFGASGRKAVQLAVKEQNKALRKAGSDTTVKLAAEDTQSDPQAAVQAARKLTGPFGAQCLVGDSTSSGTLAIARAVVPTAQVPMVSMGSSDELTGLDDNGFVNRSVPPDSFQGPAIAKMIAKVLGGSEGKRVNVGARNDAYGTGLVDSFTKAWTSMGGEVGKKVIYDPKQSAYDSEARALVSGKPDGWAFFDFPDPFATVAKALARTGEWDPSRTFGSDALGTSSLAKVTGAKVVEGLRGTTGGIPDGFDTASDFGDLYNSTSGPPAHPYDAHAFDAAMLCFLATVAAGSTDGPAIAKKLRAVSGPPGQKVSWEQLPAAIRALQQGKDIDYVGATGEVDLDENGDATAGVYDTYVFKGGEIKITGEVPL